MYATFYMYGVSSLLFFYTGSFTVTLIGSRPKLNPKIVVAQFVPITFVVRDSIIIIYLYNSRYNIIIL